MLTSGSFLFLFLPLALLGFFWARRTTNANTATGWMLLASLAFYSIYDPRHAPLLVASTLCNYWIASNLWRCGPQDAIRKFWFIAGLATNLLVLAYFKYAPIVVDLIAPAPNGTTEAHPIPLGLSFLTFVQIAFLVDIYAGKTTRPALLDYCVLTTFFPKVIAGPIVRQEQLIPQLPEASAQSGVSSRIIEGTTLFIFGLAKKLYLGDGLNPLVDSIYGAVAQGQPLSLVESWVGVLAYTFQIYFDFSGYSDMAIGIALWFGLRLPQNFNSPYKATSISDYWRRWHMTLSAFLRDYIYFPLGGSRRGRLRQYGNLIVTMALCGLWHGAHAPFIMWGLLHGVYLCLNHAWKHLGLRCSPVMGWALTFLAVCFSRAWFRADSLGDGWALTKALVGTNGLFPPNTSITTIRDLLETPLMQYRFVVEALHETSQSLGLGSTGVLVIDGLFSQLGGYSILLIVAALIAVGFPNSSELAEKLAKLDGTSRLVLYGMVLGALLYLLAATSISGEMQSFIYREF